MPVSLATVSSFPCQSVYKIANLLSPPTKYSLISSSLWNEIVNDLYLTYSVFKYINYLSQYPYPEYIQPAIDEFLNFPYQFTPYQFTPLLIAQKGIPLTADEFNKLIDAIIELANEFDINLKTQLSHVQHDQIVKSSQFSNIIYAMNQLLTFNYNTYFLLSCSGYEFSNLLSKQNTFLNVLIGNLQYSINIPSSTYIKNLLIYQTSKGIFTYGSIGNLVIETNNEGIFLYDFSFINLINMNLDEGGIYLHNNSYINSINISTEGSGIYLNDYSNINYINEGDDAGGLYLNNYAIINTVIIQAEYNGVYLNDNTYISTLYVVNNVGGIYLSGNAVIENLICKQNSGGVYISGNAKIINNQCI